jgi:hypothetical protein
VLVSVGGAGQMALRTGSSQSYGRAGESSNAPILDQPGNAASAASAARVMSVGVPAATRA